MTLLPFAVAFLAFISYMFGQISDLKHDPALENTGIWSLKGISILAGGLGALGVLSAALLEIFG